MPSYDGLEQRSLTCGVCSGDVGAGVDQAHDDGVVAGPRRQMKRRLPLWYAWRLICDCGNICTFGEQELDDSQMPLLGRQVERRLTAPARDIDVSASIQ